jgi:NDP-sugar pyrophosphorylase family protein
MNPMAAPTLLILAAGMGSRFGGLSLIEPVGPDGETILDYSIYDARRAGFGRFVFVTRIDIEQQLRDLVSARFGKRLAVEYVYQDLVKLPLGFHVPAGRIKPWGTTHAILMAASVIHEPFAVINVGDFYGAESYRALAHHLHSGTPDYAMIGYVLRNTLSDFGGVARGVCQVDSNGYLEQIVEMKEIERAGGHAINTEPDGHETRLTGDEVVSMNMWGFTPEVFGPLGEHFQKFLQINGTDLKAECFIPSTVNDLLVAGQARVKVLRSADSWFGMTYREDHPRAVESIHHLTAAGYYPRKLW